MKRFFPSVLAGLALVASACGPSGQAPATSGGGSNVVVSTPPPAQTAPTQATSGASQPTTTTTAPAPAAQPTTVPPAQSNQQPSGNQEITVNALQGEPDNLDPNRSSFATEAAVIRQVFEPLLNFDKDLKPVPAAASSFDVSQDGKTYTFHLRQGAKWSDGQPVTAKDFVYSYKRVLNPDTAAEYASFFTDAGIAGAADYNSGKGTADDVGVRAVDDNTLEIKLEDASG
jgi:oligopeptide transport system substrate-binding protein